MAKLSNINGKFAVEDTGAIRFSDQTGTTGQILKSNGNAAPTWVDPNTVGTGPWLPLAGGIVSGATTFQSSLTVGGALTVSSTNATFAGNVAIGPDALDIQIKAASNNSGNNLIYMRGNASNDKSSLQINHFGYADYYIGVGHVGNGKFNIANDLTGNDFVIDTSGNVGIGIDTPTLVAGKIVHIHGVAAGVHLTDTASGTASGDGGYVAFDNPNLYIQNKEAGFMSFETSATERMRITSAGNVGIGTTSPNNFTNQRSLTVSGTSIGRVDVQATAGGGGGIYGSSSQMKMFSNYGMNLALESGTGGITTILGGNVGIGTTSPSAKLEVKGNFKIERSSIAEASEITMEAGEFDIKAHSAYKMRFFTGGSERMRIDSSGNVLIGTSSIAPATQDGFVLYPQGTLHLTRVDDYVLYLNRRGSDGVLARMVNDGVVVGGISVTGTSTTYNTSSDYRLKEDLKDFTGLNMISKIPVYDFKWKVDESRSYGVMAHELQEVLPDAVGGEKDAVNEDESINPQGVDYSKIVPLLVKAIQELEARIKILENK